MRVLLKLGGLAFAVLLDVSVAIFFFHLLGLCFGQELAWWHYLVIAPIIGVFPDFDALLQYFSQKKIDDGHHSFMHVPPLMTFLGLVGGWLLFSPFWGAVIATTWFFHFVHDSSMWDFGLKWLWPFSQNQYHFFGRKQIGPDTDDSEKEFQLLVVYTPRELAQLQEMGAFVELDTWLREIYYEPSGYSFFEIILVTGLALLTTVSIVIHADCKECINWILVVPILLPFTASIFWFLTEKYD